MQIKTRQTCRICGNPNLTEVINLGPQFFQGSFVRDGVSNPPSRKTPNLVVRCDPSKFQDGCGLIQTKHTIPPSILYANYWYQSGISQTMKNHLKSITEEAMAIINTPMLHVLDIASNDNTLLRNYPRHFKKFGVDPSNIAGRQNDLDITVINDLFPTTKLAGYVGKFDIITSIACFYDVEDPREFAAEINKLLTSEGIWIFEVAYWPSMLKNLAYDSIVNEHIIHYHLSPLDIMLKNLGMKIFNAVKTTTNGGSIKVYVCKDSCYKYDNEECRKNLANIRMEEFNACLDEENTYSEFRKNVISQSISLKNLIVDIKNSGKTVHIYGASTKLNTILGFCEIGPELIKYASERSPEKWGAKTISGIELISEEDSRKMKPDYYLVGPYHFKEEILRRESEMSKAGTRFIFPLPEVLIY